MWDHLFGKEMFKVFALIESGMLSSKVIFIQFKFPFLWIQVDFADTSIIITEPYFNFSSIQESMNEILFEEYQFQSALRINGKSN